MLLQEHNSLLFHYLQEAICSKLEIPVQRFGCRSPVSRLWNGTTKHRPFFPSFSCLALDYTLRAKLTRYTMLQTVITSPVVYESTFPVPILMKRDRSKLRSLSSSHTISRHTFSHAITSLPAISSNRGAATLSLSTSVSSKLWTVLSHDWWFVV